MDTQDLDILMGHLGDFGKYQLFQFILHVISGITAGMHMLSLVTVGAVPDHRCFVPEVDLNKTIANFTNPALEEHIPWLESGSFDSCAIFNRTINDTIRCDAWIYDTTHYKSSRGMEWDFVCDRRWMGAVAQSSYMFGVFFGAITLGSAADKYGRKPIYCWSATLQLVLGVLVAFIPEYYSFLVVRFLYGIVGSAGAYIPGFVLTMELVGPSKRTACGIAFQGAFAFGFMLVAGWGAIIKDRQLLQVIYGLHSLILIAHWWIMDESPRWLWAQGRIKESVKIIQKALKMNGSNVNIDIADYVSNVKVQTQEKVVEASMFDLFRTPNLRNKTLNICLCWFANSIAYYGLSLSTGKMSGNPYLILFLIGLVEIPSYILTSLIMDRTGRRSLIAFYMLTGGICCLGAAKMTQGSMESTTVVMIGKFLIASSFAIVYNYSAELFPTVVRNSALGLGSMCARLSGALTPLITLLDSFDPTLPALIFGVITLLSGFLTLFLPETVGQPMPESIEDGERFGAGDTCFTTCMGKKRRLPPKEEAMQQMEPLGPNKK